jgi:mannose-P-dolichol utilization defect protein 1
MQDGLLPPEMAKLALNVVNYAMLLGGSLVKLPQIIPILQTWKVDEFSEASFAIEFVANVFFCAYNLLQGHPFKTWGENAMLTIQCGVQIGLFWMLTKKKLQKGPRIASALLVVFVVASFKQLPEEFHIYIGLIPTILGTASRLPQIVKNIKQKQTGNQSKITNGLAGIGNTTRIVTTILTTADGITLLGHGTAFLFNWCLVAQILYYRKATTAFLVGSAKEAKKVAVKEDDKSISKVPATSAAQRRGGSAQRSVSPGASQTREEPKDR